MGYAHPKTLMRELTSKDIAEWLAYDKLEPFGEARADLRAGMMTAPLYNILASKETPVAHVEQWLIKFGMEAEDLSLEEVEEQDPADMAKILQRLASRSKG